MNFSRIFITEKTTFLRYIIWSTALPCCLLGVRIGVNVAAFPFLWLRNLYPTSIHWTYFCNFYAIWLDYQQVLELFLCLRPKTLYSMALVEILSCQILELLKLLSHKSLVDLCSNALSPKATAELRLYYLDKIYTYPDPQIHGLWLLWLVYRHFCQTFLWHDAIVYHTQAKTINLFKLILLQLYYSYARWANITTWLFQRVVFAEK